MSEILAPAGSKQAAISAINSGADAIYLGLSDFSARSAAENFSASGFKYIASYAHAFGVKVYVAMNTLVKEDELSRFFSDLLNAWKSGADAVILQDAYLGKFIKKAYPKIRLHLSTQAGVCNEYSARLAKDFGFDRVILARETTLRDIEKISAIIESECFIQGALCSSFSGQCYLSSFAGCNSGNRGKCKQPCRKKYSLDRNGFEEMRYALSLADLSVGENIKSLVQAGVSSFKIEGRMRRPEYVAAAVGYYKNLLCGNSSPSDLSNLKRAYNRGNYTTGLAFGQDKRLISSSVQGHIGEYVGVVKVENGKYTVKAGETFTEGDCFKILRDGKEAASARFAEQSRSALVISSRERLKNGDKVFITTDASLNDLLLKRERLLPVKISARLAAGERARVCVNGLTVEGEVLPAAENRAVTKEDVKKSFLKTDIYPFAPIFGQIETDGAFITAAALNSLRREAYAKLYNSFSAPAQNYDEIAPFPQIKRGLNPKIAVIACNLSGLKADIGILKLSSFDCDVKTATEGFKGEKFLYLPPYLSGDEVETLEKIAENFDGIYADGYFGAQLAKEWGKRLFAGTGFNLTNSVALAELGATYAALSKELTVKEAEALGCENAFYLAAGDIKVMDLIYCPFCRDCKNCDKRERYALTDENGRKFPLRRYTTSQCRFELYNCANLVTDVSAGALIDCTLSDSKQTLAAFKEGKLSRLFGNYTRGHSSAKVL